MTESAQLIIASSRDKTPVEGKTTGKIHFCADGTAEIIIQLNHDHPWDSRPGGRTYTGELRLTGELVVNLVICATISEFSPLLVSPDILYVDEADQDAVKKVAVTASEKLARTLSSVAGATIQINF